MPEPDPATQPKPRPARPRSRGPWLIAAMFLIGGVVLAGLFLARKPLSPKAPADVPWGAPERPVTVAVIRLDASAAVTVRELVGPAGVDCVFFIDAEPERMLAAARALGMERNYQPTMLQRVRVDTGERVELVGVGVLARHPLYEVGPVGADAKHSHGVSAVCVVDGRKFLITCTYASLGHERQADDALAALIAGASDRPTVVVRTVTDPAEARHRMACMVTATAPFAPVAVAPGASPPLIVTIAPLPAASTAPAAQR